VHENIPGIRGTMLFNNNRYDLVTVYGDYTLEGGWGTLGHNILTICYAGGCENNTLMISSNRPRNRRVQSRNGDG